MQGGRIIESGAQLAKEHPHPIPNAKCSICGEPAERWSGPYNSHEYRTIKGVRRLVNVGMQYRCISCDPRHKWFDYYEEDTKAR